LLDVEAALPEEALRSSKSQEIRRRSWRAFVKDADSISQVHWLYLFTCHLQTNTFILSIAFFSDFPNSIYTCLFGHKFLSMLQQCTKLLVFNVVHNCIKAKFCSVDDKNGM
jgi:hypothetical protein